jgi:cytochrome c553
MAWAAALTMVTVPGAWADGPRADKLTLCQSCHGVRGISTTPGVPSLAGEPVAFLEYQLVFFRTGVRKNPIMSSIAESLSDEDVRTVAAYYAALPPPTADAAPDPAPALTAAGAKLAGEQHCAGCHLPGFTGTAATARLNAQREDYLKIALLDFKTGKRIGGGVAAMPEIAFPLTEAEITALAHYLARQ